MTAEASNQLIHVRSIRDALSWALEQAESKSESPTIGGTAQDRVKYSIAAAAKKHGVPLELVTAIVQVESSGNTHAVRFEGGFYDRYIKDREWQTYGAVSKSTERIGLATSWGLMQIMGAVARERGFEAPFFALLCEPEIGTDYGCRHLAYLWGRENGDWPRVIRAYNTGRGGHSVLGDAYLAKVKAAGWYA